jgi:hypothetical protein
MELPMKSGTLLAVNQKLETPVIYFYSDQAMKASVDVRFPGGVVSEWFPNASTFSPAIGEMTNLANGQMSWNVDIHTGERPLPAVSPNDIWAPSRNVRANTVSVGAENEKFIFYRGLGRFEVPIRVQAANNELRIANPSAEAIPASFLVRYDGKQGSVRALGSVAAGTTRTVAKALGTTQFLRSEEYLAEVSRLLQAALVDSGLFADEAKAMVDTWTKSYFLTPGTRVLYIVPRAWTDRILPLRIQPQPQSLVRTLVGRVEILSAEEEASLTREVASSNALTAQSLVDRLGRFAEPKLLRVKQLTAEPSLRAKTDRLLRQVQ